MYDDLIAVVLGVYIFATKVSRGSIWHYVKINNAVKSILLLIFDTSQTLITTKVPSLY